MKVDAHLGHFILLLSNAPYNAIDCGTIAALESAKVYGRYQGGRI